MIYLVCVHIHMRAELRGPLWRVGSNTCELRGLDSGFEGQLVI